MPDDLAPRRQRSLMIKTLTPGLVERGKIKIGKKGELKTSGQGKQFQQPTRLDHFLITKLARDRTNNFVVDEEIHKKIGSDEPKELVVRLLYDDVELNFPTRFVSYNGRKLARTCDGVLCEQRQGDGSFVERECLCRGLDPFDDRHCKPSGVLSVLLDAADVVGGVWKFRTTSYNSVQSLLSSMMLIKSVTGGPLAGIPLMLCVSPKTVANPKDGGQQTVHIVSLEYRGTEANLRELGYQRALEREKHRQQIDQIEQQARLMLAAPDALQDEDTVDEFHPREAARAEGIDPSKGDGPPKLAAPDDGGQQNAETIVETSEAETTQARSQTESTGSQPKRSANLVNADGEVIKEYARIGDFLNALEQLIAEAVEGDRPSIWRANEQACAKIADAKPGLADRIAAIKTSAAPPTEATPPADPEPSQGTLVAPPADEEDEDIF